MMVDIISCEKKARIIVFLLLFLSVGFVSVNSILPTAVTLLLWFVVFVLCCTEKLNGSVYSLIAFCVTVSVMVVSSAYNFSNMRLTVIYAFSYLMGLFVVFAFDFVIFKKAYVDVMFFFCIISLVGWITYILFPSLSKNFVVLNANGNPFSSLLIYTHNSLVGGFSYYRNQGFTWEPGAFQAFVSLAAFFEINDKKTKTFRILIYFITLVTTFSTTGYISMLVLLLLIFKNSNKDVAGVKVAAFMFIVLFFFFVYANPKIFSSTSEYTVFGKIINFLNEDYESGKVTSTNIRYNSIIKPLELWLSKSDVFIFGVGPANLTELLDEFTRGMNTCTMVNWFAVYGVVYGGIMISGLFLFSKYFKNTFWDNLFSFMFLFVITMSENFVHNSIIYILCLYGFSNIKRSEKNDNTPN